MKSTAVLVLANDDTSARIMFPAGLPVEEIYAKGPYSRLYVEMVPQPAADVVTKKGSVKFDNSVQMLDWINSGTGRII